MITGEGERDVKAHEAKSQVEYRPTGSCFFNFHLMQTLGSSSDSSLSLGIFLDNLVVGISSFLQIPLIFVRLHL